METSKVDGAIQAVSGARPRTAAFWMAAAVWLGADSVAQEPKTESVVVIVNKSNELSEISGRDLRALFRLDRLSWPAAAGKIGGTEVSLILRSSESAEQKVVQDRIYGMTSDQLERHWVEIIYQGKISNAPAVKSSAAQAIRAVVRDPSAVSFVLKKDVTADVKILRIDGTAPGDAAYPLLVSRE